ncbi:MAG: hypothetical protein Q8K75_12375 [Chlamydiales bacterium]|nr:hypothetical protein [Chlamydiales bacterium]
MTLFQAFTINNNTLRNSYDNCSNGIKKITKKITKSTTYQLAENIFKKCSPVAVSYLLWSAPVNILRLIETFALISCSLQRDPSKWSTTRKIILASNSFFRLFDEMGCFPQGIPYRVALDSFQLLSTTLMATEGIRVGVRSINVYFREKADASDLVNGVMNLGIASLQISYVISVSKGLYGSYPNFQMLDSEQQDAVLKFRSLHTLTDRKACKAVVFEGPDDMLFIEHSWPVTETIFQNCDTHVYHVNSSASFCEALKHSAQVFQQPINILSLQGHANSRYQNLGYKFLGRNELPCMDQHLAPDAQVLSLGCNTNTTVHDTPPIATFLANHLPGRSVVGIATYFNPALAFSSFNGQTIDLYHYFPIQEGGIGDEFFMYLYENPMLLYAATAATAGAMKGFASFGSYVAATYAYRRLLNALSEPPVNPQTILLPDGEPTMKPSYVSDKGRVKVEKIFVHGTEYVLMLSSEGQSFIFYENEYRLVNRLKDHAIFRTEFGDYDVPILKRHLTHEDFCDISEFTETPECSLERAHSGPNTVLRIKVDGKMQIAGVKIDNGYVESTSEDLKDIVLQTFSWSEVLQEKKASDQSIHHGVTVQSFVIWQANKCPVWFNRNENFFAVEVSESHFVLAQTSKNKLSFTVDDIAYTAEVHFQQYDQDLVDYWRNAAYLSYDSNLCCFEYEFCTFHDEVWDVLRKQDSVALRNRSNGYVIEGQLFDEGSKVACEGVELTINKERYPWSCKTSSGMVNTQDEGKALKSYVFAGKQHPIIQVPCINAGDTFLILHDEILQIDILQETVHINVTDYPLTNETIDLHMLFQNAEDRVCQTDGTIITEKQHLVWYQGKLLPIIYDPVNASNAGIRISENQILIVEKVAHLPNCVTIAGAWHPFYTTTVARHKTVEAFDMVDSKDWGECQGGIKATSPFLTPLCFQERKYFFKKYNGRAVVHNLETDQHYTQHKNRLKTLRSVELELNYLDLPDLAKFSTSYLPLNDTEILHTTAQTDTTSYEVLWVIIGEKPEVIAVRNAHELVSAHQQPNGTIVAELSGREIELELLRTRHLIRDIFSGADLGQDSDANYVEFEEKKCPLFTVNGKVAVSIDGALVLAHRSGDQHLTFWYKQRYYCAPVRKQVQKYALTNDFNRIKIRDLAHIKGYNILKKRPFTVVSNHFEAPLFAEVKANGDLFTLGSHRPKFLGSINENFHYQ